VESSRRSDTSINPREARKPNYEYPSPSKLYPTKIFIESSAPRRYLNESGRSKRDKKKRA
jgi:hypothetical protein